MKEIIVVAGIIKNQGKILLAQRPPADHLAGFWEFPGGKVEPDETEQEALKRELKEELGISATVGDFAGESRTVQRGRVILLRAYFCTLESGEPQPHFHQRLEWVLPAAVRDFPLAEADLPFLPRVEAEGLTPQASTGDNGDLHG